MSFATQLKVNFAIKRSQLYLIWPREKPAASWWPISMLNSDRVKCSKVSERVANSYDSDFQSEESDGI